MALRTKRPTEAPPAPEDRAQANPLAAALALGPDANLERVLAAWHAATLRLEQTHESLRREVARLTNELEAKNRELARKNRLADLGHMASHVAHEVRNSLVPISLYLSLLCRRLSADRESLDIVDKVTGGVTALEGTVTDLLQFTSDREPRCVLFRPATVVREILLSLEPQLEAQDIVTHIDVSPHATLFADADMFRRMVLNLVLNALDVMPHGGELFVTGVDGRGGFELEVADSGPGLTEDVAPHVFEPFFTTKSGGTGLGLAIVQRIADAHGGMVSACNCPEGGAAFTVRFLRPVREAAA
ncbi:MAG: two-component sensor histidine kinase [Planctomycetota bacterium]|nr:MAG: two-component sensor histidine kinase [Planctomycetota bacterium]